MIYLNDKISNNTYPKSLIANSSSINNKGYLGNSDYVTFSGNSTKDKKTQDRNKLIAYIIGGVALIAGIIIAVKLKHGKTPSIKSGGEASNISENSAKNVKHSSSPSSSASSSSPKLEEIKKRESELDKEKKELETRVQNGEKKVKDINLENEKAKAQIQKNLDDMIETLQPKNKEVAREVLPSLVQHYKTLGIKVIDFGKYLDNVTPKNKDFVINEGLPLIAENIQQLRQVVKDPENMHRLFSSLNAENKDSFKILLDKSNILKIKNTFTLSEALENINAQNISMMSNEIIPTIEKNPNNFKWLDDFLLGDFIKVFNKDNKNELLKDIIPNTVKGFDKSKLNYDGSDVLNALKVINSDNKKFIFDELLPHLIENSKQYNIRYGEDFVSYMHTITPKNKDFIFKEVLSTLTQHGDKLGISGADRIARVLKSVTPENKDNIKLIADNAEKFGFGVNNDNISTLESLLKQDQQSLLEKIKKS